MSEDGYWIEEGVFLNRECDEFLGALSHPAVKRGRAGARRLMSHSTVTTLIVEGAIGGTKVGASRRIFRLSELAPGIRLAIA